MVADEMPQRPPGPYFLWCMDGNRKRVSDSLPENSRNKNEVAKALSVAWKGTSEETKQTYKRKNEKLKKEFDAYVSAGGAVKEGAYARLRKARKLKAELNGTDGAGKSSRTKASGEDKAASLAMCSDEDLLEELRRRLSKRQRTEEPDHDSASKTEASTAVPETTSTISSLDRATSCSEIPKENAMPDPSDLLKRFGKKVPQESLAGMEAWMRKRLNTIKQGLEEGGSSPSDKELWKAALQQWNALSQEKRQRYAAKVL